MNVQEQSKPCAGHCGHSLDWMRYDPDLEVVRCMYPVGYACEFCGGLECGHQCEALDAISE